MIKINLLRERTVEQPVVRIPVEPKPIQAILIISVLIIASLAFGIWYWYSTYTDLQEKKVQKQKLEDQFKRLEKIRAEVQRYKEVIAILKTRTQVIEELKQNQAGPVRLMNSFVQSMPEEEPQVWLSSLSQTRDVNGDSVNIVGFGYDINSVMDFFSNLKRFQSSGVFSDVELIYYDKKNIPLKFEIICRSTKKITEE